MATKCKPFPHWYNIETNDTTADVLNIPLNTTLLYGCISGYIFEDSSSDTSKKAYCNENGTWNDDMVWCKDPIDLASDDQYWAAVDSPSAKYYEYGAAVVMGIFILFLFVLDANMWYYAIRPFLRPIRRAIRRFKRKHCSKEPFCESDSDCGSDDDVEPGRADPVNHFKFMYLRGHLNKRQSVLRSKLPKEATSVHRDDPFHIPKITVRDQEDSDQEKHQPYTDRGDADGRDHARSLATSNLGLSQGRRKRLGRRHRRASDALDESDARATPSSGYGSNISMATITEGGQLEGGQARRTSFDGRFVLQVSPVLTASPRFAPQSRANEHSRQSIGRVERNQRFLEW